MLACDTAFFIQLKEIRQIKEENFFFSTFYSLVLKSGV